MSYSVCFECRVMVSKFEKYCPVCVVGRQQDDDFWKRPESYTEFKAKHVDSTGLAPLTVVRQIMAVTLPKRSPKPNPYHRWPKR